MCPKPNTQGMNATPTIQQPVGRLPARDPGLNWGLIVGLGSCLAFWATVAFGLALL